MRILFALFMYLSTRKKIDKRVEMWYLLPQELFDNVVVIK